jgi:hypothetical protein
MDEMVTKPMRKTEMAGKAIAARDTEAPEFRLFVIVSDDIPSGLETKKVSLFIFFVFCQVQDDTLGKKRARHETCLKTIVAVL